MAVGKFHQTLFDARECILQNENDKGDAIIKSHLENEHSISSDFSRLGKYVQDHKTYLERALRFLRKFKETKDQKYKKETSAELDKASDSNLLLYELIDKLRRDLLYEE